MRMILEALSPIHIGVGEVLSPYTDYIFKDSLVHYINQEALYDDIYSRDNADQIIDQYVEFIKNNSTHSQGTYKLSDFVTEHGFEVDKYTTKRARVRGGVLNSEEIQRMMTTGTKPFIPGSTLKGAIRTAILYEHMKSNGYSFNDLVQFRGVYCGQDVFGYFARDILKHLHISDTKTLTLDEVQILKTVRWDLLKKISTIPISREVIPETSQFEFHIQTKGTSKHRIPLNFSYLNVGSESAILAMINEFYLDVIQEELNVLTAYGNKEFKHVIEFYRGMQQAGLAFKEKQNGAILRVGAGRTFVENTITLVLNSAERQLILKRVKGGNSRLFPKTRTVILEREDITGVLGWVKVVATDEIRE